MVPKKNQRAGKNKMKFKRKLIKEVPGAFVLREFFDKERSDNLFDYYKKNIPWYKLEWKTGFNLPRLVCHHDKIPNINMLCNEIMNILNQGNMILNIPSLTHGQCFANYYIDGKSYTPYHTDNYGSHVVSLSLGETRTFTFKNNVTGKEIKIELNHGDLMIFLENVNKNFKHSILKTSESKGERVNLTFFCV